MVWGNNVFHKDCALVACEPHDRVQSGRRVVAQKALSAGVTVIKQRGVAVPVPFLTDAFDPSHCDESHGHDNSTAEPPKQKEEEEEKQQQQQQEEEEQQQQGEAQAAYQQTGAKHFQAVKLEKQGCCPICFARPGTHAHTDEPVCATLASLLANVESTVYPRIQESRAHFNVDDTLLRLWLRVLAVLAINKQPQGETANAYLASWNQAIRQCSQLDTSAPDGSWIADVFTAASTFVRLLDPPHLAVLRERLCPVVAESQMPSKRHTSATAAAAPPHPKAQQQEQQQATVSVEEALVLIAGQMNCNGYSLRLEHAPNQVVGMGIFPAIAMANHSCDPNCAVITTAAGTLNVVTLRPIRASQELTVSYVDLLHPRVQRRQYLLTSKNFHCSCLRCSHPEAYPNERALTLPLCQHCGSLPRWSPPPPDTSDQQGEQKRGAGHEPVKSKSKSSSSSSMDKDQDKDKAKGTPQAEEIQSWLEAGCQLVCWTEDGGCGRVLDHRTHYASLAPLLDAADRCQAALTALSRAQLKADADAAASNNDSADRVAEAVEGCAAAIAHAQEVLRGCVGTAVSPVHRTVLQVQSVVAVCCIRSGQRGAALAPLDSAVRAMVAHLPPSWPELLEWQLRLLELHASLGPSAHEGGEGEKGEEEEEEEEERAGKKEEGEGVVKQGKRGKGSSVLVTPAQLKARAAAVMKAAAVVCGKSHGLYQRASALMAC